MTRFVQASLVLSLAVLSGCHASVPSIVTSPAAATARSAQVILTGRVQFPGYRVKATAADVAKQAVVSLINASGDTVAAGVTDTSGNFTLYQSTVAFTPTDGQDFVLEVMKQAPASAGGSWLSLRTKVLRSSGAWDSITGATIVIDAKTTAIAQIAGENSYPAADVMGVITAGGITTFDGKTEADVVSRANQIIQSLSDGNDPNGASGLPLV